MLYWVLNQVQRNVLCGIVLLLCFALCSHPTAQLTTQCKYTTTLQFWLESYHSDIILLYLDYIILHLLMRTQICHLIMNTLNLAWICKLTAIKVWWVFSGALRWAHLNRNFASFGVNVEMVLKLDDWSSISRDLWVEVCWHMTHSDARLPASFLTIHSTKNPNHAPRHWHSLSEILT